MPEHKLKELVIKEMSKMNSAEQRNFVIDLMKEILSDLNEDIYIVDDTVTDAEYDEVTLLDIIIDKLGVL